MKSKKGKATFMIFLIISLSIYSASVMGYYLNIETSGTADGIANVVREKDTLNIKVKTDAPVKNNDPRYVKFVQGTRTLSFNSCGAEGTETVCRYSESGSYSGGRYDFYVDVRNDQSRSLVSQDSYYIVDTKAPTVAISAGKDATQGSDKGFSFDYTVTDPSPCSGLASTELYIDSQKKSESKQNRSCSNTSTIFISKSSLGQGTKQVCIYGKDQVGLSGSACTSVIVDTKAGKISNAYLQDESGNQISYFSDIAKDVTFAINLTDDGIGFAGRNVYADLSGLNADAGYGTEQMDDCQNTGSTLWTCTKTVSVKVSSSTSVSIKINATDDSGNQVTASKSLSLNYVNRAPSVDDVYTNHLDEMHNKSYVGRENTITAKIESQAPIDTITADMYYTGVSDEDKPTTYTGCSGSGTTKYCTFKYALPDAVTEGSIQSLNIVINGKDTLGTTFTSSKTFVVDLTAPTMNAAYFFGPDRDYLTNGDNVNFVLNITDATSAIDNSKTYITFHFFSDYTRSGVCTQFEDHTECTVPLNTIPSGAITINGTFTDITGNSQAFNISKVTLVYNDGTSEVYVEDYSQIYQSMATSGEDTWTLKFDQSTLSPNLIDRQIAEAIDGMTLTLYGVIDYSTTNTGAQIYNSEITSCDSPYIENDATSILSMPSNPLKYIISLPLYQNSIADLSALNITCNISTTTILNNQNMTLPEIDNVNINIAVYNNPMGELSKEVDQAIADVNHTVTNDVFEMVGKAQKLIDSSKALCSGVTLLTGVIGVIGPIKDLLSMGSFTKAAAQPIGLTGSALDVTTISLFKYVNKYCMVINCNLGILDAFGATDKAKDTVSGTSWTKICGMSDTGAIYGQPPKATDAEGFMQWWFASAGVKNSLILSTVCMCLPGIIYNLNKYRQIECQYLSCLKSTAYGTPKYVCDQTREYMKCKYVYGEIFQIIPFAPIVNALTQMIKKAFTNLATLTTAAFKLAFCIPKWSPWLSAPGAATACYWLQWADTTTQVMCSMGIGPGDSCTAVWRDNDETGDLCEDALGDDY